jgi:hypothetical protein
MIRANWSHRRSCYVRLCTAGAGRIRLSVLNMTRALLILLMIWLARGRADRWSIAGVEIERVGFVLIGVQAGEMYAEKLIPTAADDEVF